jgi:hypothetical protein
MKRQISLRSRNRLPKKDTTTQMSYTEDNFAKMQNNVFFEKNDGSIFNHHK